MAMTEVLSVRRPAKMWMAGIVISLVCGVAAMGTAVLVQWQASRPVGEGELFRAEADSAAVHYQELLSSGHPPSYAVRAVRNALGIEAVGLVGPDGVFLASSAPEQAGEELPGFLQWALGNGRLAALAITLSHPISIDGVTERAPGDGVYQVLEPLDDGSALVLSYDISALLNRRSRDRGIRPATIQLGIASVVLLGLAAGLGVARASARRRIADAQRESELHASRSRELEQHNRQLDDARRKAERALALAEETNRVRSEFVLMINHELRTPLTSVVTGAELLLDQPDLPTEDRTRIIEHLVQDGRRLVELVHQMLTVARVENRGLQFELSPVSARKVLESFTGRADWLEVRLPTRDVVANTDAETLRVLLGSLADNAQTHGAEHVEVSVSESLPFQPDHAEGKAPDNPVYFLVADDGPGIDHDFLPAAFEKFEKRGRASGTGLGLYLARMMAEALEGHLVVKTGPSGTTFGVGLPAALTRQEVMA